MLKICIVGEYILNIVLDGIDYKYDGASLEITFEHYCGIWI